MRNDSLRFPEVLAFQSSSVEGTLGFESLPTNSVSMDMAPVSLSLYLLRKILKNRHYPMPAQLMKLSGLLVMA
jgi:hypothetical protein